MDLDVGWDSRAEIRSCITSFQSLSSSRASHLLPLCSALRKVREKLGEVREYPGIESIVHSNGLISGYCSGVRGLWVVARGCVHST